MTRIALVGGVDPTGRAGLAADLEAVLAQKCSASLAVSALTVQGDRFSVQPVGQAIFEGQFDAALKDASAVKVGMLANRAQLDRLSKVRLPLVVDPVVLTSKGERLSPLKPADFFRLPAHTVLTPNAEELAWLGGAGVVLEHFFAVVEKSHARACDRLYRGGQKPLDFEGKWLRRSAKHHRGTGCRFASALACGLALGEPLPLAVRRARKGIQRFLAAPIIP